MAKRRIYLSFTDAEHLVFKSTDSKARPFRNSAGGGMRREPADMHFISHPR